MSGAQLRSIPAACRHARSCTFMIIHTKLSACSNLYRELVYWQLVGMREFIHPWFLLVVDGAVIILQSATLYPFIE